MYISKATPNNLMFYFFLLQLKRLININLHSITSQSEEISRELRTVNIMFIYQPPKAIENVPVCKIYILHVIKLVQKRCYL